MPDAKQIALKMYECIQEENCLYLIKNWDYKPSLVQWQIELWNLWVPTGLLHLPPRRFSSASRVRCGGAPTRSSSAPDGDGERRTDVSCDRPDSSVHFRLIFNPEMRFGSCSAAAHPRAACYPLAASLLLPSPKLSLNPGQLLPALGFLEGIAQAPQMPSLSCSCP